MIDLLCLNVPYIPNFSRPSRSPCVTRGGTFYYPISLATACSYAENLGYKTKLVDAVIEGCDTNDVLRKVFSLAPKVVLVDTSTPSIYNDIKYADLIQNKLPKAQVVLVGRHATYAPNESLRQCSNEKIVVARREFYSQVIHLLQGTNYSRINGISYKSKGKIVHNKDAKLIDPNEFGWLSKIYKRDLSMKKYFYASTWNPYILLQTAWGCPYNCSFCDEVIKNGWRHRSIEDIIAELKYLDNSLPFIKEIYWDDPTFVVNEDFTQQLCNAIIENKIKVKWSCVTRANISLETLKIMKKANARTMHIGLESANQESLNLVNKGMMFEDEVEYLKNCEKVGILNHGCFIFGLPGDTHKTIRRTIEIIKTLPSMDSIQIFPLIPTPFEDIFNKESKGTAWEYLTKNNFLVTRDYSRWLNANGSYNCMVSYPKLTHDQIEKWVDIGYKEFYFRSTYILHKLKQSILNWQDLKRNARGFRIMVGRQRK